MKSVWFVKERPKYLYEQQNCIQFKVVIGTGSTR